MIQHRVIVVWNRTQPSARDEQAVTLMTLLASVGDSPCSAVKYVCRRLCTLTTAPAAKTVGVVQDTSTPQLILFSMSELQLPRILAAEGSLPGAMRVIPFWRRRPMSRSISQIWSGLALRRDSGIAVISLMKSSRSMMPSLKVILGGGKFSGEKTIPTISDNNHDGSLTTMSRSLECLENVTAWIIYREHEHKQADTHAHIHKRTDIHTHIHTYTYTHTYTHIRTHTYADAHIHMHTRFRWPDCTQFTNCADWLRKLTIGRLRKSTDCVKHAH